MAVLKIITFWTGDAGEMDALGAGASIQQGTTFGLETGEYALKAAAAFSAYRLSSAVAVSSHRFWFKFPTAPGGDTVIWRSNTLSFLLELNLTSSRTLKVTNSSADLGLTATTGSTQLSTNTNYEIFVAFDRAAGGVIKVWLGSSLEIDITHSVAGGTGDQFRFFGTANPNEYYFGHILVTDSTTKPPSGHSVAKQPSGANGTYTDWERSSGAVYDALLNQTPYNSASYVEEISTAGAFTVNIADFSSIDASSTINACKIAVWGNRTTGGGTTHSIRRRLNGVDTDTTAGLGTSATYVETPIWTATVTNLNSMEAGGAKSGAQDTRFYDLWVVVDFTPPSTQTISPTGFSSTVTPGTFMFKPMRPSGFASTVTVGTEKLEHNIPTTSFISTVTTGTDKLELNFQPTGFVSTVTEGTVAMNQDIIPSGFLSTVTVGTEKLEHNIPTTGFQSIVTTGIDKLEHNLPPTGFQSLIATGTPIFELNINPTGFLSTVTTGTEKLEHNIPTTGFQSLIATGLQLLEHNIQPSGFLSTITTGTQKLELNINVTGFLTTVITGIATLNLAGGVQTINVTGFLSTITTGLIMLKPIRPNGFQSIVTTGTQLLEHNIPTTGFQSLITIAKNTVSDNFNRANEGPPPSSSWITSAISPNGLRVVSNQLVKDTVGADNTAQWNTIFEADQEAQVTFVTPVVGDFVSLFLRYDGGTVASGNWIRARIDILSGNDTITIRECINGTESIIGASDTSNDWLSGDIFKFRVEGTSATVWRKRSNVWTLLMTRTVTRNTSGYVNVRIFDLTVLDDFFAGSIGNQLQLNFQPSAFQSLIATGVATLNLATGTQTINVTGFVSTVAEGVAKLELNIPVTGFLSTVTTGTQKLELNIPVTGFLSTVTTGTQKLELNIPVTGFLSTVTTGTIGLKERIGVNGFQSVVTTGTERLEHNIPVTGFLSSVTTGTDKLEHNIQPNGFQSLATFGTITIVGGTLFLNVNGFQVKIHVGKQWVLTPYIDVGEPLDVWSQVTDPPDTVWKPRFN